MQGNFPADYDVYAEVMRKGNYDEKEMSFINHTAIYEAGANSDVAKISQRCRLGQIEHIRGHFSAFTMAECLPEDFEQLTTLDQANLPVGSEVEQIIQATPNGIYSMVSNQTDLDGLTRSFLRQVEQDISREVTPPRAGPVNSLCVENKKQSKVDDHISGANCTCSRCKNADNLIAEEDKEKIATKKNQKKKKKKKAKKKKDVEDDTDDDVEGTTMTIEDNKLSSGKTTPTKHADPYSDENDDVDIGKLSNKVEIINTEGIVSTRLFTEINQTASNSNENASVDPVQKDTVPKTKKAKQQQQSSRSSSFSRQEPVTKQEENIESQRSTSTTSPTIEVKQKQQQQQSNNGWIQVKNKKEELNQARSSIMADNCDIDVHFNKFQAKPSFINMVPILELKVSSYKGKYTKFQIC